MARARARWHGVVVPAPAPPPPARPTDPAPRAGGAIIALGVVGGAIAGVAAGQPTAGVLIGLGASVAIAVLLWLRDRGPR